MDPAGPDERVSRASARLAGVVVPFPHRGGTGGVDLGRLVPGGRTLLIGLGVAAVALVALLVSTATSLFAVREIAVEGAPPGVASSVRATLAGEKGSSLVGIDLDRLEGVVESLPSVAAASFDRAFPNTLRVVVVPEQVVGLVRQGRLGYLVSARGRIVARVAGRSTPSLPRIWAPRGESLVVGERVPPALRPAVRTVSPLRQVSFPARVAAVRAVHGDDLRLRLRSGLEVRLGTGQDVLLKLAVTRRILPLLAPETTYVDVSVPERPVAGTAASEAPPVVSGESLPAVLDPVAEGGAPVTTEAVPEPAADDAATEARPEVETLISTVG